MSTNPIQRKIRNSFFLGVLVMLIIVALVGILVFFMVVKPKLDKKEQEEQQLYAYVYRLKKGINVTSGEEITDSMVECVEIPVETAATDFIQAKRKDNTGILRNVAFTDGYKSKVNLVEGTILTYSMLYEEEATPTSQRYVEYNMITIPVELGSGEYVDIRLRLPNGQDMIVVSKKQIISTNGNIIGLYLTEDEIVILNSAIVEAYMMSPSSELYTATYTEPGMQEKSTYTYSPRKEVVDLIQSNPNIVSAVREAITNKYYGSGAVRNPISDLLNQYAETASENLETKMQEQIENARKAREEYLAGLEGT